MFKPLVYMGLGIFLIIPLFALRRINALLVEYPFKIRSRIVKEVFLFWIGANCVGGPYE
jgi:hypothetical protein